MKIEIYHRTEPRFDELTAPWSAYHKVAELESDEPDVNEALDRAWRATNTLDDAWFRFPRLDVVPEPGVHRSTSVGDLLVVGGWVYLVLNVGFQRLARKSFH